MERAFEEVPAVSPREHVGGGDEGDGCAMAATDGRTSSPTSGVTPTGAEPTAVHRATALPVSEGGNGKRQATVSPAATATATATATGPAKAAGELPLPPHLHALVEKIQAGWSASGFSPVRGKVLTLASWRNPYLTAFCLFTTITIYLAHTALAFSLPAIAANALFFLLLLAAVVKAYSAFTAGSGGGGVPLPAITLPVEDQAIDLTAHNVASGLKAAKAAINHWLTWTDAPASIHAVAYIWLATRFSFLISPGWLFFFALVLFAATPAYLINQSTVDGLWTAQVMPQVRKGWSMVHGLVGQGTARLGDNHFVIVVTSIMATFTLVYLTWDIVAMTSWMTLASFAVSCYDVLGRVAGHTPSKRE